MFSVLMYAASNGESKRSLKSTERTNAISVPKREDENQRFAMALN